MLILSLVLINKSAVDPIDPILNNVQENEEEDFFETTFAFNQFTIYFDSEENYEEFMNLIILFP